MIKSTKKGIRNALKMRHLMAIRQNKIENFTKIFDKTVVLDNQETFRIVHFQDNKMILNIKKAKKNLGITTNYLL